MASAPGDPIDLFIPGLYPPVSKQAAREGSEDVGLVTAARDGDRAAFGRLYDRYARMVHGVLLAKVPFQEVNDLLQDVFLTALRRLRTLREPESFGAWLTAIARNRASDYHRRALPEDPLCDNDVPTLQLAVANGGDEDRNLALKVLEMIKGLPDAYRETLILRLVEGMTGPEIAARTQMTEGSVRVNLHRGMQQLRAKLSRSMDQSRQETP
jgi:RNA polymerase sigma-70 factor, ECF subfamily